MIAVAVLMLTLAAVTIVAQARRIERLTRERDDALVLAWRKDSLR